MRRLVSHISSVVKKGIARQKLLSHSGQLCALGYIWTTPYCGANLNTDFQHRTTEEKLYSWIRNHIQSSCSASIYLIIIINICIMIMMMMMGAVIFWLSSNIILWAVRSSFLILLAVHYVDQVRPDLAPFKATPRLKVASQNNWVFRTLKINFL